LISSKDKTTALPWDYDQKIQLNKIKDLSGTEHFIKPLNKPSNDDISIPVPDLSVINI